MNVEFVWSRDCPNVKPTRRVLVEALRRVGLPVRWTEWCVEDPDCPPGYAAFGSPAILVDGRDATAAPPSQGEACRTYVRADGTLAGVPDVETVAAALRAGATAAGARPPLRPRWQSVLAAAPAVGIGLLPKVACPACWPAYAGFLGSLGVGFLIDSRILFAWTAAFLVVALFFLGFRADRRHGYGPLVLGSLASAVLLVGKFHFESDPAMFAGVGLLMAASVWNAWPRGGLAPPIPVRPCCAPAPTSAPAAPCCGGPSDPNPE